MQAVDKRTKKKGSDCCPGRKSKLEFTTTLAWLRVQLERTEMTGMKNIINV